MQLFVAFILFTSLLHPTVMGIHFESFVNKNTAHFYGPLISPNLTLLRNSGSSNETSDNAEFRVDSSLEMISNETSETNEANFTSDSNLSSKSTAHSTDSVSNTSSTPKVATLTEIFSNESQSSSFSSESSSTGHGGVAFTNSEVPSIQPINESSTVESDGEEIEEVIRGTPKPTEVTNATTSKPETAIQKALKLLSDTYTLSILIPIAAGVVFATTIIITIATCRCLQRRCRRRRLRRKALPDSVKNFRPSDSARLLAESSDEEF